MPIGYYEFTVPPTDNDITLKSFLRRICGLSARSMKVIRYGGGSISRDDTELRAHDILHSGDSIKVRLPQEEQSDIMPIEGTLDILFEDDRLLIVNKPPHMPVHPTKIHQLDTLANIVMFEQERRGERYPFRALNRLDKDTSGIVILAKDRIAYNMVFSTIQKTYVAVCEGIITEGGTIDLPIGATPDSKIQRCVREDGAKAITHYKPIQTFDHHTLCKVWLETGRTHQIRCHMSAIGYPLAGDDLYGGSVDLFQRQALHCRSVTFPHPITKDQIELTAPFPADFSVLFKSTSP
ncbi:RluA family pseudouridine synthase [Ruminococcus sp.]|uniref:RluA family pseudouridine synthase n=1 Tax=Ruminococcus sp. TaxID=41978 RepID=UPI00386788C1